MSDEEYQRELFKLLGVRGPMGEVVTDGHSSLVYRMPDGSSKYIQTPTTDAQRGAIIQGLRIHIGIIEARRALEPLTDDECGPSNKH